MYKVCTVFLGKLADIMCQNQSIMKQLHTSILFLLLAPMCSAQLADGSSAPDFIAADLSGEQHHLQAYLDSGKTVILNFGATWSGPDWWYFNSQVLQELYMDFGPAGSDELVILFLEADDSNTSEDLYGLTEASQGDYVTNTPFPIIDNAGSIFNEYAGAYYPTIFTICPDGTLTQSGQSSYEEHVARLSACIPEEGNCGNIISLETSLYSGEVDSASVPLTGVLSSIDIELQFASSGSAYPGDMMLTLGSPSGACIVFGGWNIAPADTCENLGTGANNSWPGNWNTTANGTYNHSFNLTGYELSGTGDWSVYIQNAWTGTSNAQYNLSVTLNGVCAGECSDPNACNYNPDVTPEEELCYTAEDLYGTGYNCDGTCLEDVDGDGICDEYDDCFGDYDDCGVCGGDNSTCSGCTDPSASNYDASSTLEDGSCLYNVDFSVHLPASLFNQNSCTLVSDQSNDETPAWQGLWMNNQGDGIFSINLELPLGEFNYLFAPNGYWPNLELFENPTRCTTGPVNIPQLEDSVFVRSHIVTGPTSLDLVCYGSCIDCVFGCTNPIACNYDFQADADDGSCLFYDALGECGGAFFPCGPGTHWDNSTNLCVVTLPMDGNFDGCVSMSDLLDLLSSFGTCLD